MANKLSVCLISVDFKTRNYKTPPYRKLAKTIFEMGEVVKPTLQITLLRSPLKPSEIRNQIIETVFRAVSARHESEGVHTGAPI